MNFLTAMLSLVFVLQLFDYRFLGSFAGVGFTNPFLYPDRLVFMLIILAFIILLLLGRVRTGPLTMMDICMLLFAGICTWSYSVFLPDRDEETRRYLTTIFNMSFLPFTAYFVARNIRFNEKQVRVLLTTLVFIGIYLALTGLFEHFGLNALVWPKYILDPTVGKQFGRSRGPFVESAWMGRALVMTSLAMFFFLTRIYGLRKTALASFLILSVLSLYFTYTRGPWLCFAASVGVIIFFNPKFRSYGLAAAMLILLALLSGTLGKFSLESNLFTQRQETKYNRMIVMNTAVSMIKAKPWSGIGYGRFEAEWPNYLTLGGIDDEYAGYDGNHNTFLGIAAEVGLFGCLSYALIFYFSARLCLRVLAYSGREDPFEKDIATITLCMIATYVVSSQFIDSRFSPQVHVVLFTFIGLVQRLEWDYSVSKAESLSPAGVSVYEERAFT